MFLYRIACHDDAKSTETIYSFRTKKKYEKGKGQKRTKETSQTSASRRSGVVKAGMLPVNERIHP